MTSHFDHRQVLLVSRAPCQAAVSFKLASLVALVWLCSRDREQSGPTHTSSANKASSKARTQSAPSMTFTMSSIISKATTLSSRGRGSSFARSAKAETAAVIMLQQHRRRPFTSVGIRSLLQPSELGVKARVIVVSSFCQQMPPVGRGCAR